MDDLFQQERPAVESVSEGVTLLAGFADANALLEALPAIAAVAPFRNMVTPGGKTIGVAVTNCGTVGRVSDRRGYRYQRRDPDSQSSWPVMPASWEATANEAARIAGFDDFSANACLINRYLPGNQMTAHQDKNEGDFGPPVVTISTGLPAEFLVWGESRTGRPAGIPVYENDVIVMGGPARLHYHGVRKLKPAAMGRCENRISLTFRQVDLSHVRELD